MIKKLYDFRQTVIAPALLQAEVTGEEIAGEVQQVAARFTTIDAVHGPIQNGDVVTLEFADEKQPEGMRRIYANVGKGFSDLEELLPGLCQGDTVQIQYAGKKADAKIACVKRPTVPAMTDEYAQQLGIENVTNMGQLEDHLFQKLAEGQRKRKFRGIMGIVTKAIMEKTEFEPLEESHPWYRALHERMMGRVEAAAAQEGKTVDEVMPAVLRMGDKTPAECRQALKAMCTERVRQAALGQVYAQEAGVVYTKEEVIASYLEYGVEPDEAEVMNDLMGRYVDYLSQVVYEYFAPQIQVDRK